MANFLFLSTMRRQGRLLVLIGLWAISATAQAQLVQVNQHSAATTKFSLSGTGMNTGMLSSFDANLVKVSPSIIGETTLPFLPMNHALLGGNNGTGVNDPVVANNLGNRGQIALVPEPSTWAMILLGAGVLVASMRFRQRRA
jgi:hypothetical protein